MLFFCWFRILTVSTQSSNHIDQLTISIDWINQMNDMHSKRMANDINNNKTIKVSMPDRCNHFSNGEFTRNASDITNEMVILLCTFNTFGRDAIPRTNTANPLRKKLFLFFLLYSHLTLLEVYIA